MKGMAWECSQHWENQENEKAKKDSLSMNLRKNFQFTCWYKGPSSQIYCFTNSHIQMWKLVHEEGWELKNWCIWIVVLEKTLESPLDIKEIKPFNPKGNHPWIFIGRMDAEAEAPILWPPDVKGQLTGEDPDAGKDWGQEEKGVGGDEMAREHHPLNWHESEQNPGDRGGQKTLMCYSSWGSQRVGPG